MMIYFEISHEEYTRIIKEEEEYRRLKEDIRIIKSKRSDSEKHKLINEDNRIRINKIIGQNNGNA